MGPAVSVTVGVSHPEPKAISLSFHPHPHHDSHLLNPLLHLKRKADPLLFWTGMLRPLWSWASLGQEPRAKHEVNYINWPASLGL